MNHDLHTPGLDEKFEQLMRVTVVVLDSPRIRVEVFDVLALHLTDHLKHISCVPLNRRQKHSIGDGARWVPRSLNSATCQPSWYGGDVQMGHRYSQNRFGKRSPIMLIYATG